MCSAEFKLFFYSVAILLVFLMLWYIKNLKSEHLQGNHIYTAGATMRVIGQQFSSTDQGTSDISYNVELPKNEQFTVPYYGRHTLWEKLKKKI